MENKIRFAYSFLLMLLVTFVTLNLFGKQKSSNMENVPSYEMIRDMRTDGNVDFQIRTTSYNGQYAPLHCFAMWVTDANDQFVRTLEKRAYSYQHYLTKWNQMTGGNVSNALITSASLNGHITHNITWDCTDSNLQPIPDGTYKIYCEFTESNATGVWTVVEFEKGAEYFEVISAGPNNFHNIELYYNPASPPNPLIEIVSPTNNSVIEILPFIVNFNVENFDPAAGDGFIGLYVNNQFYQMYPTLDPIVVTDFPAGINELKLILLDPTIAPLDPEISDTIMLTWNPIGVDDVLANNIKLQNYPNPFNPSTEIHFQISEISEDARIEIYNFKGQKIRTFPISSFTDQAINSLTWSGTDDAGNPVSSGAYYYRLTSGVYEKTNKMILLK